MAVGWIILAGVGGAVFLFVLIAQFNRMVVLRNRVRESWSNVDTELQRRHELIPNLVAAVKGYAKHETTLMRDVTRVRLAALGYRGEPHGLGKLEGRLAAGIDRLLAVAEAYPALKASANFLDLQQELSITEDRIQAARRFYNGNVRDYHNKIRTFPGNIFAPLFGFRQSQFFQIDSLHLRRAPKVTMRR